MSTPLLMSDLPLPLMRRGKVRDVYDLGDSLLIVATDRISAFDVILRPGIPDKGTILTRLSNYWFQRFEDVENHLLQTGHERYAQLLEGHPAIRRRSVVVNKCQVIPFECVARGYLAGSGLKDYERSGEVCGIPLPRGLEAASELPEPIFTPATKADTGHDQNVSYSIMEQTLGRDLAARLRALTLSIYSRAATHARERGIIIADTKFEFGLRDGRLVWIDEALTPDSSRFWPLEGYRKGRNPPSYDKQYVRDWLEATGWNKTPPSPELPPAVVAATREKYVKAFEELTGERFA